MELEPAKQNASSAFQVAHLAPLLALCGALSLMCVCGVAVQRITKIDQFHATRFVLFCVFVANAHCDALCGGNVVAACAVECRPSASAYSRFPSPPCRCW